MKANLASLAGLLAVGVAASFAGPPAHAAQSDAAARATYLAERADCEAGRTAEDRATCLREAAAAEQERKRNHLDNAGSAHQNAIERCNLVPASDKADCLARIEGPNKPNQTTTTSGSVAGGGILRETKTVTTGLPTIVILPGTPAASAPR